jgi:hypothetical protein
MFTTSLDFFSAFFFFALSLDYFSVYLVLILFQFLLLEPLVRDGRMSVQLHAALTQPAVSVAFFSLVLFESVGYLQF